MENNEKNYDELSNKYESLKTENSHNKMMKYIWYSGLMASVLLLPRNYIDDNKTVIEFEKNNIIRVISPNKIFYGMIPAGKNTTYFVDVGNGKYITKKAHDENQIKYAQSIKDSLENIYKQKTDSLNIVMSNQKQHTIDSLMNYKK